MKKILFVLFSLVFISAGAQTVDEVIQKYAENLGGLDAFNKIKTAKMTGSYVAQGNEAPLTVNVINNKAVKSEVEVMGNQIVSAYKDGKGWKINPFSGASTATEVSGSELAELKNQSMMAPTLVDYKARGHKVELEGQEDVEGTKTFKIKLTTKEDGKVTTYYISTTDYSLLKSVTDREMMGQTFPLETYYSDAKDINGIKFYMTRSNRIEGQEVSAIKFDTVEFNVPIDEKIFDMPQ